MIPPPFIGRGAGFNPPNRFQTLRTERPPEDLTEYFEVPEPGQKVPTRVYVDRSKTLLSKNDSPDLGFTYSLNPYRGCEHGCVYCYARPSHEYLGFSAGLDFETKIVVKLGAARLLEQAFRALSWRPEVIVFSGNTDCYQPLERTLGLTRQCLRVFADHRHPVALITKNALIQRDLDILRELASRNLVFVVITVTTLNQRLAKTMEPRASAAAKRLETIGVLAAQGIPVGVNVAPVIPGLTDAEIPSILREAAARGARSAGYTIVRLSHGLKDLFQEWVQRELPDRGGKILARLRDVRGGELSDPAFGTRMTGSGSYAETIRRLFHVHANKYGLNKDPHPLATDQFIRPHHGQLPLFPK